jgi:hypothetical protein
MENLRRTGLEIAIAALALGVAGDSLLRSLPWGLNVPLMAVLAIAAVVALRYRRDGSMPSVRAAMLYAAVLFFTSWFAIRDSQPLLFLNALAVGLIGTMLFLPVIKIPIRGSGVIHYALSGIAAGFSCALLPFMLLTKDVRWNELLANGRSRKAVLAIRGVLIAAPLVMIFGALFVAADAAFEGLVQKTFRIVPEELFLHAFFTAFFAWPAAGFLRAMTLGTAPVERVADDIAAGSSERDFSEGGVASVTEPERTDDAEAPVFGTSHIPSVTAIENETPSDEPEKQTAKPGGPPRYLPRLDWRDLNNSLLPDFLTLGPVEIGVVLGSLNLLFLLFVLVQLPYLFGGMDLVQAQPGLKLAEYARRGFGELFVASMLVLPMLMALHWLIRREAGRALTLFRYLAATQIGLLFVIMLSASQRMLLLTGELGYGMTLGRFYPMVFMVWLAVVFLIFALTVLRGRRDLFAWHAAMSALVVVAALNFLNPDDFVVRTNLALMREGRAFDAVYNSRLSADAFPALVEVYPELNLVGQDQVLGGMVRHRCFRPPVSDLRTWNLSRRTAQDTKFYRDVVYSGDCGRY